MLDKAILLSCSYVVVTNTLAYCITALFTSNLVKCLKPMLDKAILLSCSYAVVMDTRAHHPMRSFTAQARVDFFFNLSQPQHFLTAVDWKTRRHHPARTRVFLSRDKKVKDGLNNSVLRGERRAERTRVVYDKKWFRPPPSSNIKNSL
jgi:hypothetical protein